MTVPVRHEVKGVGKLLRVGHRLHRDAPFWFRPDWSVTTMTRASRPYIMSLISAIVLQKKPSPSSTNFLMSYPDIGCQLSSRRTTNQVLSIYSRRANRSQEGQSCEAMS